MKNQQVTLVVDLQYCSVQYHFPKLAELADEMDDNPMDYPIDYLQKDEPKRNIYALIPLITHYR